MKNIKLVVRWWYHNRGGVAFLLFVLACFYAMGATIAAVTPSQEQASWLPSSIPVEAMLHTVMIVAAFAAAFSIIVAILVARDLIIDADEAIGSWAERNGHSR